MTFEWDPNGNLIERTEGGDSETFSWDVEQHLASVEGPDGDTSFVYDAGGQRVLRRTSAGATLYFAGHEVTSNVDGSQVTAVRSYSFSGHLVASRTPTGLEFTLTDERGSVETAAPPLGVPSYERAYQPYGQERAADGTDPATDQGFLGQIEDNSTDLSYLNARYYDTTSGVFISPDPVYDTKSLRSLNPYTYAQGNPTTLADPFGLSPAYIIGLENQNRALRAQNQALIGHIGTLTSKLIEVQGIIQRQNRLINDLVTRVEALEALVRQQATMIRHLQARVRELTAQVAYWRGRAYYWRGRALNAESELRDAHDIIKGQSLELLKYSGALSSARGRVNRLEAQMAARPRRLPTFSVNYGGGGGGLFERVGGAIQRAGHVARFTINAPRTVAAVGLAYASGGSCGTSSGLMFVCSRMAVDYSFGNGMTVGNTYLSSQSRQRAEELMYHESAHATQWAMFGWSFPLMYREVSYLDALAGGGGCGNPFEMWAGLEEGDYTC